MKERIQPLVDILERDQANEEAINGLEELVTGEDADSNRDEILEELEKGKKKLLHTGRFEAACKLIDLALSLVDEPASEVELLLEQARLYDDELFRQKTALEIYEAAQNLLPDDEKITRKILAINEARSNWKELVEKFSEQAEEATEASLKGHMLYSAAERTYKNHKRGKDIPSLLYKAIEADPGHLKAARLLEKVLRERERWEEVAQLYTKLAEHRRSREERAQMLLAAAHTYVSRLEDKASAAGFYSDVIDLVPGNQTALRFLVKYYEEQEDWDHLAAVYEDALAGRPSPEEEVAMLMQTGMIHWRMKNNLDTAEEYFRRLRKLNPAHEGMINFYRSLAKEKEDNTKLIQVLSDAQRTTDDDDVSDRLTKEIAQLAAADGGNVERAIDAWKTVLRKEADNQEAKGELKRLYKESEKWNALLDLLKSEADTFSPEEVADKVKIYEEMVTIYRDYLNLGTLVINTYKTILSLDPENSAAQEALSETYEKEGRWNDLINLLGNRAQVVENDEDKIKFLLRVASLWIERFNNFNRAVNPLEEILTIDPKNESAIETLRGVYNKRRAWRPLIDLLEKEVSFLEGEAKCDRLREMAKLAAERLSDHARAIQLWRQVLDLDPESKDALSALEKLTERSKDWEGLSQVIEMRVEQIEDDDEKVQLLTKLGIVFKERLRNPSRAASAWKQVLEIKPDHAKSMRSLKEAYLAAQDWDALKELYGDADDYEGLVEVLGIAADRVSKIETKIELSFKCAEIYDYPIGQPDRALRHYERVLGVEPENERAARALADIYRRGEKWNRLLTVLEVVLDHTDDTDERVTLMMEMRELSATRMNNRALAFDWAARAFSEKPHDVSVRETLETAAEAGDKYGELVSILREHLPKFEGDDLLKMERYVAELSLDRLGAVDDAVAGFQTILERNPNDEGALFSLEDIFRKNARFEDLVKVLERRISQSDDNTRKRDLMIEIAQLFEDGMDKPELAEERFRDVLDISPEDREALHALERLARTKEDWEKLSEILEQRRSLSGTDSEEWRKVTLQLGALYDEQLKNKSESIVRYTELLNRYPGDEEIIEEMEHFLKEEAVQAEVAEIIRPHLVESRNWRMLAWVLAILIESSDDSDQRLELQTRLAEVYKDELGDQRVAFDTLGAALREHPNNTVLWDKMSAIASDLDLLSELADRLQDAYRSGKLDDENEIDLATRLADLIDLQLGRPADAAVYHLRVFEDDPNAEASFKSLESLFTSDERWGELLELYNRALESGSSQYPALDLQLKICFILEEVEQNVEEAIKAYRVVMEMDPENHQAIRALTSLYEDAEAWQDLSELLQGRLGSAEGEEAAALRYRLGEIAEQFLDSPADALEYHEQVLMEDPDYLKSQEALERLIEVKDLRLKTARVLEQTYDHQGAAEPLARVLVIELEDEELVADEIIDILRRVADLRERRLGDPRGAFDALSQAFSKDPANEQVREDIARLALENDLNSQYADVLDKAIPTIEDDVVLAAKLISEVAGIYDEQLNELSRAEGAYRRLLNLDPDNPETAMPAVEALERILTGSESWEQLLDVLRIKVRLTDDPLSRKEIVHQMAEIEESVLERIENAMSLFREVLEYDDSDMNALLGLERLYERSAHWDDLIEIIRRRAIVESSAEMRRDLLYRVATLFENQVANVDEAIAAYLQVSEESGPDRDSLEALSRLYEQTERWRDLLDTYELKEQMVDQEEERAALFFRMGDLLRTRLDEPDQAISRLGEALNIDAFHAEARSSLEAMLRSPVRLDAIEILRPIYESESSYENLIKCDEIETEESEDPLDRSRVLRHAAEVAEIGLNQPRQAFEFLGRAFRDGTADPELGQIIGNLERLASQVDGYKELVALYREVGPDILDGELQVRASLRVAEIAHAMLDDLDLAREYYVKVLDIDGENSDAMNALEVIYEKNEQYSELFEIYRRKAQCATDDEERTSILFKQARLCELNLDDVSGASSTYERILDLDSENREAMEALERLYPKDERWNELMDLLERRVDLEDTQRVDLLHRLGKLAEDKLGDDERALDYFGRALEIDSAHAQTLESLEASMDDDTRRGRVAKILEPVYKASGDWNMLVGSLDAQLEYCDDSFERKELLKQIGTLHEEQLGNLENAFETFSRLFNEDVEDKSSWDVLTRLASVLEAWSDLADVYETALDNVVGDTPTTAELSFNLGEIYENRLEKPEKATRAYRRTLSFAPDDPQAFSSVERMLLATETWPDLLDLYRDAADAALEVDRRKGFIFKIAEIQESANDDLDAAIDAFRDVIDIDDRDEQAVLALDRLYYQAKRFEDLAMHLRAQIDQAEEPETRNQLRCRLGQIYEENLDDLASSVDTYEEALEDEGGGIVGSLSALEHLILREEQRQRIADILEPIYRDTDEWKKLVVILGAQVEFIDDPADKAEKFREIAELHSSRGHNYLLAFEALANSFRVYPSSQEVLDRMVSLTSENENWDELVKVLNSVLEDIYDLNFKVEVLHLLGSTFDQKLDMPRKAISAYTAVLDVNDADGKALDALEGLYNLVGDWEGLVDVLAMKANFATESSDRAELLRTKASIHEDLMSSNEDAIDSYRQALDTEPTSEVTMDALERLYHGAKEWVDLIEIKTQRADVVEDEEQRLEILRSIAEVYEEHLDDPIEAIGAWRTVQDHSEQDIKAIQALDRLYTAESMFPELLDNLNLQKEIITDQAILVETNSRIGELQEKELSDLEGAIVSYRNVLSEQPTHTGAIEALERLAKDETMRAEAIEVIEPLHREYARWDRLAEILELKLGILDEPDDRLNELLALAELHESGRSEPIDAFDVYARALAEESSRVDVMESLERIAEAESLWDRVTRVYEDQVDNVYDAETEWALLTRLGEIKETRQNDLEGAISAYRRALDSGSTDPQVLSSLDRLYLLEQKWTDLDEVLEREIEFAESVDETNQLKLRQGAIREREFGDVPGAIAVFKDVVEASPENDEAVTSLQALLNRDEFVEDVVEVLTPVYELRDEKDMISALFEHRLRVAESETDRVQLYRDLAAHQEGVLGDLSATFDAYGKAFEIDPNDTELLSELERLASDLGAWAALVEIVENVLSGEMLDQTFAVDLGLRVAEWASTNVGDPVKAETLYRSVLEREPEHQEALTALEELLRNLGKFEELIPIMKQRAEATYDFEAKKEQYTTIARIARLELGDTDQATEAYRAVRELDESDLDAIDSLIELYEEKEDYEQLIELFLARAEYTQDVKESNQFRHRASTLYLGPLEKSERAVDVFGEILDTDPSDRDAISQLEVLYQNMERWTDLSDLLSQRLDIAENDEERVEVYKSLAALYEKQFEQYDDAVDYLNEILLIQPDDSEVIEGLKRLYTKTERWQDFVELLENQADRARDLGNTDDELGLLTRIGEIWDERLDDSERATSIYERVLERDAEHVRALAALSRLYEAAGDWERCAEVLNKAAAAGRGGPDEAEVHFRLALLNQSQMNDADTAAEEFRKALDLDPTHMKANSALADYCRENGDHSGLLETLIREEDHIEDSEVRVAKLLEMADLQASKLSDDNGAVESLERAKELVPDNKDVLLKLSDAFVASGRQDDAIPVIESLIDAETDGGKKRSRKAAVYHQRLANAYLARGDQEKGADHLEAAYKLDISNIEVLVGLGRLHYDREDYDKAVKLFRALLLQRFDPDSVGISKADVYWYVGDISLRQGDTRKAKGMFQRGLDEDKDHEQCKAGLTECS